MLFFHFQIYTDWANHYLEKIRYKRVITDLQTDISDGVLLAEVIYAVSKYQRKHLPSTFLKSWSEYSLGNHNQYVHIWLSDTISCKHRIFNHFQMISPYVNNYCQYPWNISTFSRTASKFEENLSFFSS